MGQKKKTNIFRKKREAEEDAKAYETYQEWILTNRQMMISKLIPLGGNRFQLMTDMIRLNDEQYKKVKEEIEADRLKKAGIIVPESNKIIT